MIKSSMRAGFCHLSTICPVSNQYLVFSSVNTANFMYQSIQKDKNELNRESEGKTRDA